MDHTVKCFTAWILIYLTDVRKTRISTFNVQGVSAGNGRGISMFVNGGVGESQSLNENSSSTSAVEGVQSQTLNKKGKKKPFESQWL